MTDEQSSNWEYKMICCLSISTSNSDINVVALHKTVKELYEQGRFDEREACAKLCEEVGEKAKDNDGYTIGGYACAKEIRARGEK